MNTIGTLNRMWPDRRPLVAPTFLSARCPAGGRVCGLENPRYSRLGDVEVHLEFMVARGANSGVIFHGNHEVQILDSYGVAKPTACSRNGARTWRPRRRIETSC